jgi:predicted ATPase
VPEDLLTIIKGRIARLDEDSRHVLQAVSVVGLASAGRLLELITSTRQELSDRLATLEGMGFLQQTMEEQGPHYVFHHVLVQELLYNSIKEENKRRLHANVVKALLSLYGEDSEIHYQLLAYHATVAQLPDVARKYLRRSAEAARAQYASLDAIDYYESLLSLLLSHSDLPDTEREILETLLSKAELYLHTGERDEAAKDLQQAVQVAFEVQDPELSARCYLGFAWLGSSTGRYEKALEAADIAEDILSRLDDQLLET